MRETDLYDLFKPFIKWKFPNARIHTELDDRDVVVFEDLVSDDTTHISEFELKLSLNKELLKQMCSRDSYRKGHYLYAVVPINQYNQEYDLQYLFRQMGWGLITINLTLVEEFPDYAMRYCRVEVEPKMKSPLSPHKEPITSQLFRSIQEQAGGSVRTRKFTGFKADLENIYYALKGLNRPRSWKNIQSIMLDKGIDMPDHKVTHRLKCLEVWGIVTVTKRGRTKLYKDNRLGDEATKDKILNGSKKRVR